MTNEKYGLIGKTLVHSYSKEIHEALGRYQYQLFSLAEDEMPDFINARDFRGLNVTIPYKKEVIPLCDEVTDLARGIGAVNTLFWKNASETGASESISQEDKILVGHNTDYEGFLYAASRAGIDFEGKGVLILGTRRDIPDGRPGCGGSEPPQRSISLPATRKRIRHPARTRMPGPQHRILRPTAGNRRLYRRDRQYHTGRDFPKQHAAGDRLKDFPGARRHRCDLQPV